MENWKECTGEVFYAIHNFLRDRNELIVIKEEQNIAEFGVTDIARPLIACERIRENFDNKFLRSVGINYDYKYYINIGGNNDE